MAEGTDRVRFKGFLNVPGAEEARLPIANLTLSEDFNAGWRGQVKLGIVHAGSSSSQYVATLMANGVTPGKQATVEIVLMEQGDDDQGETGHLLRRWSVMVGAMKPLNFEDENWVGCSIDILDPVSFLADRPIWGAYRACSIAEIIGGAISMAAGGDGKPTLWPAMAGLPTVSISPRYRNSLEWVEYAIAAGQSLGDWLAEIAGLVGFRIELWGVEGGEVVVVVTDAPPGGTVIPAYVAGLHVPAAGKTAIELTGLAGKPPQPLRVAVLDDVTQGRFPRVPLEGSVGRVVSATGLDIDEVGTRVVTAARGRAAEQLALTAQSTQPGIQIGRILELPETIWDVSAWQVAGVRHSLEGEAYANSMTLYDAANGWCPAAPPNGPDIIVPGEVDAGDVVEANAPVARDRMGRIPVSLAFQPGTNESAGEEAENASDGSGSGTGSGSPDSRDGEETNGDGEVTLADFTPGEFADLGHWEAEAAAFESGEMDDPFPGRSDASLNGDEFSERQELAKRRLAARRYRTYRRLTNQEAEVDRDLDGQITRRDALIEAPLEEALADGMQGELAQWHASALAGTLDSDYPNMSDEDKDLLRQYDRAFGPDPEAGMDQFDEDARQAEEQKWPARLPLPVVNPMAGRLHGFVPAHRQRDACRVVVHNPFSAEVLGFQYRDDRPIGGGLAGATAGLVVEHDAGSAWSGLVFRSLDAVDEGTEEEQA